MAGCASVQDYPAEVFPGYAAPIIQADVKAPSGWKVDLALFGLIPSWAKDRDFDRRTYNARSETVAEKPNYRTAWRQRKFCLVPMDRFYYEPCWERAADSRTDMAHGCLGGDILAVCTSAKIHTASSCTSYTSR